MEWVELIIRYIFMLQMIFWGLNGFLHFMSIPPSSEKIDAFVKACIDVGFIMPTVKVLEIVGGLMLICSSLIPLGLSLFAPLIFVITLLHACFNPKPWGVLLSTSLPYVLLLYFHHQDLWTRLVS
jgi:hypothetical protein